MEALRRRNTRALAVAGLALAALIAGLVVGLSHKTSEKRLVPAGGGHGDTYDPLSYDESRRAVFEQQAAAGLSHVLYAKSPGGAVATAQRVARYRPLVTKAAAAGKVDANTLEAIVFLESAGRPDVIAGGDPANASGLTQILAQTGSGLLAMHVDLAKSRKLTKKIAHARGGRLRTLLRQRRHADDRFDPAKALAGTVRYLQFAREKLKRTDLSVVSYHMGVGNLQTALQLYTGKSDSQVPYAQLYFDSTPLVHRRAYRLLAALGDDSSTYYWRVLAATQIMRLYRTNPAELKRMSALQNGRSNAELVLHPPESTRSYDTPRELRSGYLLGSLEKLPNNPSRIAFRVDPSMGSLAKRLHAPRPIYRGLRPEALALLAYMSAGTRAIAGGGSLIVTSSVRDNQYQRALMTGNIEATHGYSLHTTGFAFDIARLYSSKRQALAFQFMLDRLTALNLIAWAREPQAIHITVSSEAKKLEPLLGSLGA
ncbi:MAG: transglycosylase SLT domain-containing protein [Thermoleophilaceae bacterium]